MGGVAVTQAAGCGGEGYAAKNWYCIQKMRLINYKAQEIVAFFKVNQRYLIIVMFFKALNYKKQKTA